MKLLKCFFAIAIGLMAQCALAARPNYTYVGLGYGYDYLDIGCHQNGPFIEGSVVINELYYVRLQHTDLPSDSSECGSTTSVVGGGVYVDMGATSSAYANLSLVRRDYGSYTELGLGVGAGFRSILDSGLEVLGFLGYQDIDVIETTYLGAGVNYWLTQSVSVDGALTLDDDNNEGLMVGVRYNF